MIFKKNNLVIGSIALIASFAGRFLSQGGMDWYKTLVLSPLTPPGWAFGLAWTIIYLCTAIAAIYVWNEFVRNRVFYCVMAFFLLNAVLNVFWTYLFFHQHFVFAALVDAVALWFSVIALMVLTYRSNKIPALLLLPYFCWVAFAIYLNYQVYILN